MSAECESCGSDLDYYLHCARCEWQQRAEKAEAALAAATREDGPTLTSMWRCDNCEHITHHLPAAPREVEWHWLGRSLIIRWHRDAH